MAKAKRIPATSTKTKDKGNRGQDSGRRAQPVVVRLGPAAMQRALYAGVGLLGFAVVLFVLGAMTNPWFILFGVAIVVMLVIYFFLGRRNATQWSVTIDAHGITAGRPAKFRKILWSEAASVELKGIRYGMALFVKAPDRKPVVVNLQAFDSQDRARLMAAVARFAPKKLGYGVHWSEFIG